jgi:PIN domain nuclease of toxin-antitoxin system
MKVLLDTHAFRWAITEDARLSEPARQIFLSGANQLFLSVASLWEIVLKVQIGKLPLPKRTDQYLLDQLSRNTVTAILSTGC